jgi:glycerol-3-phosphate dehydrogenase
VQARRPLEGESFQVVIIGGGINGVAIARECALAGRRTLLLEQHDFAAGTTSRSTRIIHGGLRYLEHGEVGLVRQSLRERERLLRERPHLVRPLQFLLALGRGARRNALELRVGLWLYRSLSSSSPRCPNAAGQLKRFESLLDCGRRWSLFSYEDAQCEFPERLVAEWLSEAVAAGAVARNYSQVLKILRRAGRVTGVLVRDTISGAEAVVDADWIINATGPWADQVCERSGMAKQKPLIGGIRGSHLVLPRFAGAPEAAVYAEGVDGRPIFVIPWNGQVLLGTTEVPDSSDPGATQASDAEVQYLFASFHKLFPAVRLSWSDVRCAFAGIRPLPFAPGLEASAITRRHILHDHAMEGAAGMISVIGGKLTTAAALARECARKIGIPVTEPQQALGVAAASNDLENVLRQWAWQIARIANIPESTAHALAAWHGRHALTIARLAAADDRLRTPLCEHSQHIVAEAVHAFRNEGAVKLADALLRRVPVALGPCWSEECSRQAAERIGCALGWDGAQIAYELQDFELERENFLAKPALSSERAAVQSVSATSSERSPAKPA